MQDTFTARTAREVKAWTWPKSDRFFCRQQHGSNKQEGGAAAARELNEACQKKTFVACLGDGKRTHFSKVIAQKVPTTTPFTISLCSNSKIMLRTNDTEMTMTINRR